MPARSVVARGTADVDERQDGHTLGRSVRKGATDLALCSHRRGSQKAQLEHRRGDPAAEEYVSCQVRGLRPHR